MLFAMHRRLPLLLLLTTLSGLPLYGAAHGTAWQKGWGLASRASVAASAPSLSPLLTLERQPGALQVWVDHRAHGPLQVQLRAESGTVPGLPLQRVLPGHGRHLLLTLPSTAATRLVLDAVPGRPLQAVRPEPYALPFDPHLVIRIDQPPGGGHSHHDQQNRHAWDFALPENTPVLAARAGIVMDRHGTATGPSRRPGDGGNWVRLLHEDGTMAVYAHLAPGSLAVLPGQRVTQGQRIARSGNTGDSSGPHLHFVVQRNAGLSLAAVPVELNGPRGRLQTPRSDSARP